MAAATQFCSGVYDLQRIRFIAKSHASVVSDSVRPYRQQPTRLPPPWDSPGKNTGVGCRFLLQCMKMKSESEVAQLCLTLSDPMDCNLPDPSVHGIFQARVLEWGAPSSRAEGLLVLHGLESNPGSSLQTEEEAGLP